ncbi:MAG: histidinol dehydrogenase, partial [Candidatus Rariloculaceae bacterium]
MTMKSYNWNELGTDEREALLRRPALAEDEQLQVDVERILSRVRENGDRALRELTAEIDGIELTEFQVGDDEFAAAETSLTTPQFAALTAAAENIRAFHEAQLSEAITVETAPGVVCERVTRPIQSVGLYVPAGTAPLPSTALMLAIPAAIAGCRTRVMCTPPQKNGRAHPAVLVAAKSCGLQQ